MRRPFGIAGSGVRGDPGRSDRCRSPRTATTPPNRVFPAPCGQDRAVRPYPPHDRARTDRRLWPRSVRLYVIRPSHAATLPEHLDHRGGADDGDRHLVRAAPRRFVAGARRVSFRRTGRPAHADDAACGAGLCGQRRGRGGRRPGNLDRRAAGHRPIRGPLDAPNLAVPDPRQHRQEAGCPGPARFRRRTGRLHGQPHRGPWPVPAEDGTGGSTPLGDSPDQLAGVSRGSVLGAEVLDVASRELEHLPDRQRIVVVLRDVLGYDAAEVSAMLSITAANQRVLLHRGRAHVRQALEDYLGTGA